MGIFKNAFIKLQLRRNPIKYWRNRGAQIGDLCQISPSASLGSEPYLITIGNKVRINDGVNIITHDGGVWVLRNTIPDLADIDIIKPVKIGNNVHIGTNSIICPGVTIGDNFIIGLGAIVTKDVDSNSIVAGIPAKKIESIDEYYKKHLDDFLHTKKMSYNEKRTFLEERLTKNRQ